MANRNFPAHKAFSFHMMPVRLDAQIAIGAAGAPTIVTGLGINSITRLSAGTYQIQFQDNYPQFLTMESALESPVTGSAIAGGSFVVTTVYQIVTLGTTTQAQWVAAGVPSGITAAPGVIFKAATIGAGNGTVKAIGASGIPSVELIGNPQVMLNNQPYQQNQGGYLVIQCLGPTSSSVTTSIPVDPPNGSTLVLEIWMNNSSVQ